MDEEENDLEGMPRTTTTTLAVAGECPVVRGQVVRTPLLAFRGASWRFSLKSWQVDSVRAPHQQGLCEFAEVLVSRKIGRDEERREIGEAT